MHGRNVAQRMYWWIGVECRLTGLRATGEQDVQTRSDRALQEVEGPPTGT